MRTDTHTPRQHHLLAAPGRFERLQPHPKLIPLRVGRGARESGGEMRHLYFPTDSIVSLLYVMADGASAEIAVVGMKAWLAFPSSWAARPRRAGL